MKLTELKQQPEESDKRSRSNIAKGIIDILAKADPNSNKHIKIFHLGDKAAGRALEVDSVELRRNRLVRDSRARTIANSSLNTEQLSTIKTQMEKLLQQGR